MSTEQATLNPAEWDEELVARTADVPEGSMLGVTAGGRPYVIFQIDGGFVAYRDQCPHQGAQMSCGVITGAMLPGAPDQDYEFGLEGRVISCPRHHWKFAIDTGESLFASDRRRLLPAPLRVTDDGQIFLLTRRRPAAADGKAEA